MAGGKPVLIPLRLVSMAMCLVCIPKYNLKQPAKNNITYSVQHIIKLLTREKRKFTVRKMCCAVKSSSEFSAWSTVYLLLRPEDVSRCQYL